MRNKSIQSMAVLLAIFSSATFASFTPAYCLRHHNCANDSDGRPIHWFVGGSLGMSWPSLSNGTTSVLNGNPTAPPNNSDLYTISSPDSGAAVALRVGYRWERDSQFFPVMSVALNYMHINSFNTGGVIEQYSLPASTTFNYTINISPDILTLLGKVDIYQYHSFAPYVSLGLGEAFVSVSNYSQQTLSSNGARNSPGYTDSTNYSLAYTLGLGVDYFLNHRTTASLSYEYAHLGQVRSGNGVSTWSDTSLSFGDLTSHIVLLNISYQLPVGS